MNILVVDDQEENRYFLEALFRGHGHAAQLAGNGAEALNKLRSNPFDLIVSDILMPVMDGFQLCREVKASEALRHIPIIIYTATYTGPQDETFARTIGADQFIIKPCEPDLFMEAVGEVMARSREGVSTPAPQEEEEVLKLYNERLVRKLEHKMLELEKEVLARRETEEALRESEERHRRLFETMPQGVLYRDMEGKIIHANPAAVRILGLTLEQMRDPSEKDPAWLILREDGSEFPPDAFPSTVARRTNQTIENVVMGLHNPERNQTRWIRANAFPFFKPGERTPSQITATFDDITERKRAEEENAKLQAQFQQAQKMESVGRLAGGVAHDFNNLLSVILGYTDFLLDETDENSPVHESLVEIRNAGKRAATLTRQLLSFSRKLVLEPQVLDLNAVVSNLKNMLRRLIGEDIDLHLSLGSSLWPIKVDPGQLEQVIMNLVVNARDAMPDGGKLTLETFNVEIDEEYAAQIAGPATGPYVTLAVSDTGCGMSAATMQRLFEPFFTTKEKGKGTGLGLSTVYGIVKQSGGSIKVYSEPGHGTTFKVYLPRPVEIQVTEEIRRVSEPTAGGKETILIVEDDDAVRKIAVRMLRKTGYQVLSAENASKAVQVCEQHPDEIHLLLTDVVMPQMNGCQLAERLQKTRSNLRVLYMSGYTDGAIARHGVLNPGIKFIGKPFNIVDLARKVRDALDDDRPPTSPVAP